MNDFAKQAESAIASLDPAQARRQVQVVAGHARLDAQSGNRTALPMAELLNEIVAPSNEDDWPAFVAQTRDAFSPEATLFYHSALPEKERQRNALLLTNLDQDPDRRLVFAVDAANERLDILSLYDIVKLDNQSRVIPTFQRLRILLFKLLGETAILSSAKRTLLSKVAEDSTQKDSSGAILTDEKRKPAI